ncbi:MAG TPA: oligosaccharide flippase family protein, partial [Anaerolineales bacterium]|nr:oligosaccharide flippase family protein [Anaerolineales bacterium]
GEYLEKNEKERAGALVKAAGLTEAGVSCLAFLVVLLTAGLATRFIAKTPDVQWMFIVYSIGLLANFNTETSTGILQITDKIRLQGTINLLQSIVTALLVVGAFVWKGTLTFVLIAYLIGKVMMGLGIFGAAQIHLRRALGGGWWKAPFAALPSFRELARFAISSNLSATIILVFRESEILWVGYFLNASAAGYYRVAYNIISLLSIPADPLILTVYPEINRLIVQKAWPRLRDFLRKITTLSFAYNLLIALGLIVFGHWVLLVFGSQYGAAYPALMALLVGIAFNYTLFWNRPLLLSFNLPVFPLWATLIAGLLKVGLAFPLVPRYGYVMEGALLSLYYMVSVGLMVGRGLQEMKKQESFV